MVMKVSREQMLEHRERILGAAGRLFRERGLEGVSVAEIMQAADLTHGGFYGHFKSKEDLMSQAMAHEIKQARGLGPNDNAATFADAYLNIRHRDNRGTGCPIAALGSEAARAAPGVREALTQSIRGTIEKLSDVSLGATPAERRRAAIASWSAMVGAMVLARVVDDSVLSKEILSATRASVNVAR
jgi:TetR/AcrR family transcriptional regulator, transcriptional repressor for nem operon